MIPRGSAGLKKNMVVLHFVCIKTHCVVFAFKVKFLLSQKEEKIRVKFKDKLADDELERSIDLEEQNKSSISI